MTEVKRTPANRFEGLVDWPWESTFTDVTVDETPMRLARVDTGPLDAHPIVMLHGEPTWGYLWRHVMPPLLDAGHRVVVPDQVGFGRSDKPQGREWYTYPRLASALDQHLAAAVGGQQVTLVVHDWGGMLGLPWAARNADRIARLVICNTGLYRGDPQVSEAWQKFHDFVERSDEFPVRMLIEGAQLSDMTEEEARAWEAPFPDASYHGGPLAMPGIVIRSDDQPGADDHRGAWQVLEAWDHAPVLTLWGAKDPIIPPVVGEAFARRIPSALEPETVEGAHFLQNDAGTRIGERIVEFITATPTR